MLAPRRPAGFYTQEMREGGMRWGFELVGLDGRRGILSSVDLRSGPAVGRYGVDIAGFEAFLEGFGDSGPRPGMWIIDEIGKMECLSQRFRVWLISLLDTGAPVLATIALRGTPFIESLKLRSDVRLIESTRQNRDTLMEKVLRASEI